MSNTARKSCYWIHTTCFTKKSGQKLK